ncbi:MAG: hypothetical protein MZW92_56995 [Comamonadaceae bacterium]|nr:hypothetical protein [Comamonadaceae bacterium]
MRALAWPDAWPASDIGAAERAGHARRATRVTARWPKPGGPGAPTP